MKRLDQAVAEKFTITRSLAAKYIKQGLISIKGNLLLAPDKGISDFDTPFLEIKQPSILSQFDILIAVPQDIPLDIVYEDENVLVINKIAGMSVHPSEHESKGTLANALVFKFNALIEAFPHLQFRPGIVHRLDKYTSGIIIVAKNANTHSYLAIQFEKREVKKEYHAIISGLLKKEIVVDLAIMRNKKDGKKMTTGVNGREAKTEFIPQSFYFKDKFHTYTYLKAFPMTGRTHQIRVHLKSLGHPIIGDIIYNGESNEHMYLHAYALQINIPIYGKKTFQVNTPDYFDDFLSTLTANSTLHEQEKL